nr:Sic1.232 [Streptococcus pyogenes]
MNIRNKIENSKTLLFYIPCSRGSTRSYTTSFSRNVYITQF